MAEDTPPPGKIPGTRALRLVAAALLGMGLIAYVIHCSADLRNPPPAPPPRPGPPVETIPPGIVVSESTQGMAAPPLQPGATSPGDSIITGYGSRSTEARQDLVLLSRSLGNFLLLEKSAAVRPLSANAEWSKALAGKRDEVAPWFSPSAPVWNSTGLLVDRWNRPLHFHALGGGKWEIRSIGPDGLPYSPDDLVQALPVK